MFIIYGQKTALIKHAPDHFHACKSCNAFNMYVSVFRNYAHVYFLPFFPTSKKYAELQCRSCGAYVRSEETVKEYAKAARTPIWFYTLTILIGAFIAYMFYSVNEDDKKNLSYVSNPKKGDVYTVKNKHDNKTYWLFLKVMAIKGDTVVTCHSNYEYDQQVTKLQKEDYFVSGEEFHFTRADLKKMFEDSDIGNVYRDYGSYHGFDRVK